MSLPDRFSGESGAAIVPTLNNENYEIMEGYIDLNHHLGSQLVNELQSNAQMKHTFDIIACLNPKLKIDIDGLYHYVYEPAKIDVNGKTVHEAMMAFSRAYYIQNVDKKDIPTMEQRENECEEIICEVAHFYGGWDKLRKVIERLEESHNNHL